MDPEQFKLEDPVWYKYVCSFVACFLPGRILTLGAELLLGSKLSSTSYFGLKNVHLATPNNLKRFYLNRNKPRATEATSATVATVATGLNIGIKNTSNKNDKKTMN